MNMFSQHFIHELNEVFIFIVLTEDELFFFSATLGFLNLNIVIHVIPTPQAEKHISFYPTLVISLNTVMTCGAKKIIYGFLMSCPLLSGSNTVSREC